MYIQIAKLCPEKAQFMVPHKKEPMSARRIAKRFPAFAELFDGLATENTLAFYYKYDKIENVYHFIDADSEEEVAELMGVTVLESIEVDEEDTLQAPLTTTQIAEFRDHIADLREGLAFLSRL